MRKKILNTIKLKIENILFYHTVLVVLLIGVLAIKLIGLKIKYLDIISLLVLLPFFLIELFLLIYKYKALKYNDEVRKKYKYRLNSYYFRIDNNTLRINLSNYENALEEPNILSFLKNNFNNEIKDRFMSEVENLRKSIKNEIIFEMRHDDENTLSCNWYNFTLIPFARNNSLVEIVLLLYEITSEKQYQINVELLEKIQSENKTLIEKLKYQVSGYDFIKIFFNNAFTIFTENNNFLAEKQRSLDELATSINDKDIRAKDAVTGIYNIQNKQKEILNVLNASFKNIIDSFKKVDNNTNTITEICGNLGSRIEELNEILNLILSITDKTKTLSINASIESAHAGSTGAGFKIIADEIKKLSENTEKNTNNIQREFELFNTDIEAILEADKEIVASLKSTAVKIEEYITELKNGHDEIDRASEGINSITGIFKEIISENIDFIDAFSRMFQDLLTKNNDIIDEMGEAKKQIDNVKIEKSEDQNILLF